MVRSALGACCVNSRVILQLFGLGQLKKKSIDIRNEMHELPSYSIVPQPTMLPHAPKLTAMYKICKMLTSDLTYEK
jgi:hypothetical protein